MRDMVRVGFGGVATRDHPHSLEIADAFAWLTKYVESLLWLSGG